MNEIKLLILDVDGTLTAGGITILDNGTEAKTFYDSDGLLLRALPSLGIQTAILTGRLSRSVEFRAKDLRISKVLQGIADKPAALSEYLKSESITFDSVGYVGNDLNDYTAMMLCAFRACPSNAAPEIRGISHFVSEHEGGNGAVRDVCEHLLKAQGKYDQLLELFGIR